MTKPAKAFTAPALLAALSLTALPAAAAELPVLASDTPTQVSTSVSNYGGGWGGRHRYRHRGRTSAGDVIGAVLVLGTIAAVASAASKANRERGYPYPDRYPRPDLDRRGDYRPDNRSSGPQGVDGAADLCVREIERDGRVEDVTRVERNAAGWLVTGAMADGAGFTCSIGADGRIDRIQVGGRAQELGDYEARSEDNGQTYRPAEAQADDVPLRDYPAADVEAESGPLRDYPGGPAADEPVEDEAEPE